jgi:hypothetical protein
VVNDIIWISCNITIQPNCVPSSMAFKYSESIETLGLSTVPVGDSTTSFDSFPILTSRQYFRTRQHRRRGFAESVSFQQHHSPIGQSVAILFCIIINRKYSNWRACKLLISLGNIESETVVPASSPKFQAHIYPTPHFCS